MSLIRHLMLESSDEPEVFAPKINGKDIVICHADHPHPKDLEPINLLKLRQSDAGKEIYYLDGAFDEYTFKIGKITNVHFREGDKKDAMESYRYDKCSGHIELDTGEKRYFSSDHFSSFIYEPDAVLKFVEDLIKRHKERGDYESISSKTADDLVKELNIDSFSKSIDVDGTTWDIDANVTSAGKTVCVTVTCTPSGKGNIKYGNRMELYFLPISDDQFKRHLGAFDRPNSANGWMSSKLKTVSKKEMEAEIHKVFETVKSKDETGYNKYFQK